MGKGYNKSNKRRTKEEMEEKIKQNTGITLVALVVTILILIILAGVSIRLILGENGILTMAKRATTETKKQAYFEELNLSILEELSR